MYYFTTFLVVLSIFHRIQSFLIEPHIQNLKKSSHKEVNSGLNQKRVQVHELSLFSRNQDRYQDERWKQ